uniref:Uncharacterized protein n=1 Tax=Glossina brevipalpis TaxID=37001 RepID=A0A1A9WEM8_9MUSC
MSHVLLPYTSVFAVTNILEINIHTSESWEYNSKQNAVNNALTRHQIVCVSITPNQAGTAQQHTTTIAIIMMIFRFLKPCETLNLDLRVQYVM